MELGRAGGGAPRAWVWVRGYRRAVACAITRGERPLGGSALTAGRVYRKERLITIESLFGAS